MAFRGRYPRFSQRRAHALIPERDEPDAHAGTIVNRIAHRREEGLADGLAGSVVDRMPGLETATTEVFTLEGGMASRWPLRAPISPRLLTSQSGTYGEPYHAGRHLPRGHTRCRRRFF
jgi:hypothetical protein